MRLWLARVVVLAGLLALAAVVHRFLAPQGLAWVVYLGLGLVVTALFGELLLRLFRRGAERADWARWRAAVVDPAARSDATEELRRALSEARERGGRTRLLQARLSIALAEIELAAGRGEEATVTLSKVPVGALEPKPAALVRLARAQAYLHRDDVEGARATLVAVEGELNDPVLEASRALVQAAVALVEGDVDDALTRAMAVLERAHPDDDLYAEASVIAAAAASGDLEAEARARLDGLAPLARRRALTLAPHAARTALGPP